MPQRPPQDPTPTHESQKHEGITVTPELVTRQLKKTCNRASPGPDEMNYKFLKILNIEKSSRSASNKVLVRLWQILLQNYKFFCSLLLAYLRIFRSLSYRLHIVSRLDNFTLIYLIFSFQLGFNTKYGTIQREDSRLVSFYETRVSENDQNTQIFGLTGLWV